MSNNIVIQNNDVYKLVSTTNSFDKLPTGNYLLKFDPNSGFYLERKPDFHIPSKLYGDMSIVYRWKAAFEQTPKNLGILLTGYKGTGKTLTAEYLCHVMKVPVIFISSPYSGPEFENFMCNPALSGSIVFIDEYEKYYNHDHDNSEALLGLMDGVFNTHLLFLLTVNSYYEVSDKLKNRLSRVKYAKSYESLDESVVEDIIEDLLINKDFKKDLKETLDVVTKLSMDILISLIKDVNFFNEAPSICVKHLNIVPEERYYDITMVRFGEKIKLHGASILIPTGSFRPEPLVYSDKTHDMPGYIRLNNFKLVKEGNSYILPYNEEFTFIFTPSSISFDYTY